MQLTICQKLQEGAHEQPRHIIEWDMIESGKENL